MHKSTITMTSCIVLYVQLQWQYVLHSAHYRIIFSNHRGKPKKGRGAREGKRIRHNDQDFDYDDDTEM